MDQEHDILERSYFGNNESRRVIVTFRRKDGVGDWYELEGGPFDWGTLNARAHRLANAILRDLGASTLTQVHYSQRLLLNLICMQARKRRLCVDESAVLASLGCKAIDDLCSVEGQ